MKTKNLIRVSICLAVLITCIVYYNVPRTINIANDRIILANDVAELIEVSDLVVVAEVMEGKENVIVRSEINGHEMFGYTVTNLNVQKVLSGELEDSIISITEEYYENTDITGKFIWVSENYEPAKEGKEYIFFLKKYNEDSTYDGMYFPLELDKGKYSLINDYNEETLDSLGTEELDISSKSDEKEYKEWYKEVMKKYEDKIK